jgi:hypothetical protein
MHSLTALTPELGRNQQAWARSPAVHCSQSLQAYQSNARRKPGSAILSRDPVGRPNQEVQDSMRQSRLVSLVEVAANVVGYGVAAVMQILIFLGCTRRSRRTCRWARGSTVVSIAPSSGLRRLFQTIR